MTPPLNSAPAAGRALVSWIIFVLAAVFALVALWLDLQVASLRTENTALNTERELADIAFKTAQTQLKERSFVAERLINDLSRQLREKEDLSRLKVVPLRSTPSPGARESTALALWDQAAQNGLLVAVYLPANSGDDDYALWIGGPGGQHPMATRVFHVGEHEVAVLPFAAGKPFQAVASFRITLKKRSDEPTAEGPTMLESGP